MPTSPVTAARGLSELEAVVLGLVWSDGPCTAYAVRRTVQASLSAQWSGSAGAVYPAVARLEGPGTADLHAVGRPEQCQGLRIVGSLFDERPELLLGCSRNAFSLFLLDKERQTPVDVSPRVGGLSRKRLPTLPQRSDIREDHGPLDAHAQLRRLCGGRAGDQHQGQDRGYTPSLT